MHNLCRISDLTVDKPWNDLSRAWNDLSMAWTGLSRAWTGVPEFSTYFFFCYSKILDPQKEVQHVGFNLDTLDGTRIQKHTVLRLL